MCFHVHPAMRGAYSPTKNMRIRLSEMRVRRYFKCVFAVISSACSPYLSAYSPISVTDPDSDSDWDLEERSPEDKKRRLNKRKTTSPQKMKPSK